MGENLSIDEIIQRAEDIKAKAEAQLREAERSLDEKARAAKKEIVVDEQAVAEKIAAAVQTEEDVKEYTPSKKSAPRRPLKKSAETKKAPDYTQKTQYVPPVQAAPKTQEIPTLQETTENKSCIAAEPAPKRIAGEAAEIKADAAHTMEVPVEKIEAAQTMPVSTKTNGDVPPATADEATRVFQEEEKTRKMAFVSSQTNEESDDLQSIPTIVAREQVYDRFGQGEEAPENDTQMRFTGFDDKIESVPKIDERQAERELSERREEIVEKFRLFGPDETDMDLGAHRVVEEDYESEDEKGAFLQGLYVRKRRLQTKMTVTLCMGIPLLGMTVFKESAHFPLFLSDETVYYITALVLYVLSVFVNFNVFTHGFHLKKSLNFDFAVSVLNLLLLAHTAILLAFSSVRIDNGVLLAGVGVFSLFMSQFGKQRMLARIIDNFEFITDGNQKYTVENIANAVEADIISRGLLETETPHLKMSVCTDFPTNFLEISCKNEPADKIAVRLLGISLLFSGVLFAAVAWKDNINSALNTAMCALAIAVPGGALFLSNHSLADISMQLAPFASRVCGMEGAAMANRTDAVVMEACDLFDKTSCDLYGIKTFNEFKVDDAIIHAAAVMLQTKSPLSHCFDDVIIGQQSILPKVDGVIYEEKLGTSAWVYKRKVLVGTRELMRMHGVEVPMMSFEEKYTVKGRKALYLALGGKLMAMFIVGYSPNPELKRELKKLEKSGMTLIVKSNDPYINEESLAELFALPAGFIRVMNYSSTRVYDKYSGLHVEKSPAYVVHDGSALGFVSAMRAAGILISIRSILWFLISFGALLGAAVTALLALLGAYSQLSAVGIIGFQCIWMLFIVMITRLRAVGL